MARYEGRHRNAPAPSTAPSPKHGTPTAPSSRPTALRQSRLAARPAPRSRGRPTAGLPAAHKAGATHRASAHSASADGASTPPEPPRRRRRRKKHVGRPILAGALALGLGASGFAYAKATNLIGTDAAAFVVGSGVVAQTDELARAKTVDTTYRAAASVSRNERRTAIAATGLRTAKELEAKKKKEAAKQAEKAREARQEAERERSARTPSTTPRTTRRRPLASSWSTRAG